MLKQIFNKRISRNSLLTLLLSILLVLNFQNCDRLIMAESGSNQASGNGQGYDGLTSSGNGQGYDGFASTTGVYYQYIDQIKCNTGSNATYSSKIDFGTVSAPLNPPQVYNNECSGTAPINLSADYLSYKPYSDRIITFEKGIYEKFSAAPTSVANAPIAFCQTTSDLNTGLDVLIRRNNVGGDYTAEIYLGREQQNSGFRYEKRYIQKFNVSRSTSSLSNTVYRADYFNLLSRAVNPSGISDGSISATIDGVSYSNLSIICKQQAPVSDSLLPTRTVVVNAAPTANFSHTCTHQACSFTNLSSDSDGSIVSSAWSLGDGTSSNATNPSYNYTTGGVYSVTLTVTDNGGRSASIMRSFTVTSTPPSMPGPTLNVIAAVDGSTDMFFVANNTTINFSVQGLGVGTAAALWTSSSTTTCPVFTSYTSASSQGWVMNSSNEWTSTQVFTTTPGVSKTVALCFHNTSNGTSSKILVSVNP